MSRPTRSLALLLILAFAVLASVPAVTGCTCAPAGSPVQELGRADAVFTGRVESIEPTLAAGDDPDWPSRVRVVLRLTGVWKGLPEGERVTVFTASQSAACGFQFESGKKFLVYAYQSGGELTATVCSRTAPLKRAGEDLQALGAPVRELR